MLKTLVHALLISSSLASAPVAAAEGAGFDEEILVFAPTPAGGAGLDAHKLPFTVQAADADAFERAQSIDLTDYLGTHLGSVSINSAQSNPLQPDVQYRGYAASPLLGLSQGIAVFQNGVRINEPFGDAVNWDLLAHSAVHKISLIGGSNPLFGLNALGGALSIEMKNGFNFDGLQAQASGGAWQRITSNIESGGNNGSFGYYVNASYFEEGGWRDLSNSDALNIFATASYRDERNALDLSVQFGDSELRGNGASPLGLLQIDRAAIFTAPDITDNDMTMFTFGGEHKFDTTLSANLTGFYRRNETHSFNGDGSELSACELTNGAFLIEGLDADTLNGLALDDSDVCDDNVLAATDPDALEAALNALLAPAANVINLDDLTDSLSGTGVLADAAINNTSTRDQKSYGSDIQFTFLRKLFERGNYFVAGFGYFKGTARFDSLTELANIDPISRSTQGLGVGTFIDVDATKVLTSTATWSVFFSDSFDLTERLTLTIGGRFNSTAVELSDRSGERPELNGRHRFRRFNPTVGATFDVNDYANVYASYSESSRAPTPIELACNEGVFAIARANAIAASEDPDDINFECRLPNAFLADPPLDQVVAKTVEVGVRGDFGRVRHRLGYFRTDNNNDIIFQTTGRGRGLFANVDKTRREGIESAFTGALGDLDWSVSYSYIRATFADNFAVLSPNHPLANDAGELRVGKGDAIPGIPAHQFKFSGDYDLPWDLRMGLEVIYNSGQYLRGDESNQLAKIDGYALMNWRASYRIDARFELFARVTNLLNQDYENFGLLGEQPGELLPGLANQSAVFLGAGAPRGGWVGLRMRF